MPATPAAPRSRLRVAVTRRLPEAVETRMSELFDVALRDDDRPLMQALSRGLALVPRPFAELAGISAAQLDLVRRACDAIAARSWDVAPARIHGDLWAGNLLFGSDGGIMIDPAAHGGHPHTDLGMLALFGAPYLEEIFQGYGAPKDIEKWIPMHQLHPLAVHALTHGASYNRPLERAAAATLEALA